jgi:transcriptional regulator with XRE-family HTH domain
MGRHKRSTANRTIDLLGRRVQSLRRERGLTLAELGRRAGLSHAFLSQIENSLAHPSISTLHDLADALGVTASDLLADTPTPRISDGSPALLPPGHGTSAAHLSWRDELRQDN